MAYSPIYVGDVCSSKECVASKKSRKEVMKGSVAKILSGHSSSSPSAAAAALLAMMVLMMALFITKSDCFSMNETITISSTWCNGLNDDPSCLIGETDLDSDEFMLNSDFSRRILDQGQYVTEGTKDASHPICGKNGAPPCLGKNNGNPKKKCYIFKRRSPC